jgi:hypothetical protein
LLARVEHHSFTQLMIGCCAHESLDLNLRFSSAP